MIRAQCRPRVFKDPPYVEMDCNYHWIGLGVHYCGQIAKLHHHHLPWKSNRVVFFPGINYTMFTTTNSPIR